MTEQSVPGGVSVQAVLDGIPASAVLLDGEGRIAAVNRSWLEFCAKNGGDLEAVRPPADYIAACAGAKPASTAREVIDGITGVLHRASDCFEFEYPCHGPDVERWFRMTVTPVPGGVLVIHHDISGEYARVSRWLASTQLAVVELDRLGNAVYVNATWAGLARTPTRHLLGSRWAEHLDDDQAGLLHDAVHDAAETGVGVTVEVRLPDHGHPIYMRFSIDPELDARGTLRRLTLLGRVIGTDRGHADGK